MSAAETPLFHLRTTPLRLFVTVGLTWGLVATAVIGFSQTPGKLRWKFNPEAPGAWSGSSIGPDGTVYVSLCQRNGNGIVYALDGPSGSVKWQFRSSCFSST